MTDHDAAGPVAWRWPLTDVHGNPTDSFGVTTNDWLASQVGKDSAQPLYTRSASATDLLAALMAMKRAFGDPMTRRALGGHNEAQQEAILAASVAIATHERK